MFPGCRYDADIVLVVDGSGSVGARNFAKIKEFLQTFVSQFSIGQSQTRVAFLQFSDTVQVASNVQLVAYRFASVEPDVVWSLQVDRLTTHCLTLFSHVTVCGMFQLEFDLIEHGTLDELLNGIALVRHLEGFTRTDLALARLTPLLAQVRRHARSEVLAVDYVHSR